MSFSTLRLGQDQFKPHCSICQQSYEAESSILNAFRKDNAKKIGVIAHRVNDVYHAYHPSCFGKHVEEAQTKGINPACVVCRQEIEKLDGKSIADLDTVIDNREEAVLQRGRLLVAIIHCDLVFNARSKTHEIQKILARGRVPLRDLNDAAIIAAEKREFNCIPEFLKKGPLFLQSRNKIMQSALDAYDWPTARLMISLGVSEDIQKNALYTIARWGDLETLSVLLHQKRREGNRFAPVEIERALCIGAKLGEVAVTRALLDYEVNVTKKGYVKAIRKAIRSEVEESSDIVQAIINRVNLSKIAQSTCIIEALAKCRFDIAWILSKK